MNKYRAIDLFAGIGGLRLGFEQAFEEDIEFVFASEIFEPARLVYETNFGESPAGDITTIDPTSVPDHDILLAGWPCQSFSIAGRKKGFRDPRGNLFFAISNILEAKRPYAFLLENVWHLKRHDKGRTFKKITKILEDELNYCVYTKVLNAKHFGVPQNRPRIFLAGFKEPISFDFPPRSTEIPKIKDFLEQDVDVKYYISQTYLDGLKKHRKRHEEKGHGFGYKVLDPEGVAHTLVIGGMGRERNLIKDKTPPANYANGSPERIPNREGLRTLTPKECQSIMGFPPDFQIPVANSHAYRVLAESVAVPLIAKIAGCMKSAMERKTPAGLLSWSEKSEKLQQE